MCSAGNPRIQPLARAFAAGCAFSWVTGDEVYGQATYLRMWLAERNAAYVLATRGNDTVTTPRGTSGRSTS
jgi:SRSO17 transposase